MATRNLEAVGEAAKAPIACTLSGSDYKDRLAWIAELNASSLKTKQRNDLRLDLEYAPAARDRVIEMVQRERECCAFLSFTVSEAAGSTLLVIEAPEDAREAADLVFASFMDSSASGPAGCGCGPTTSCQAPPPTAPGGNKVASATAAVAATAALACGACCVIPFALPAVALALGGSVIAWFSSLSAVLVPIAVTVVLAAWAWVGVQGARARRWPTWSTSSTMIGATIVLAAAVTWPRYEGAVIALLRR